jgi:site-specific recombinase XerD
LAGGPSSLPKDERPKTNDLLFPIGRKHFWAIVRKYALAAGIPKRKAKTHMLKHTIAKHLVRAGHPLNEIQEWMGWRSIETMNWYTRADEEELGQRIGDTLRHKQGLRPAMQGSLFP